MYRHLPDIETMVKLQQGLQQVYCVEGINKADAVLTEPNGIAYAQGSTYLQLYKAAVCFSDISEIVRNRVAFVPRYFLTSYALCIVIKHLCPSTLACPLGLPITYLLNYHNHMSNANNKADFMPITLGRQQIMVQLFGAMTTMGLSAADLVKMQDHKHMFEFIKATLAAAMMDGKQTPYYSDYVLHSVTPVENAAVALANLQPVPGSIEYAPGCTACFYRQHTNGVWHRYNLELSEDLRQVRTGRTLHTLVAMDDCETQASHMMASANALNQLLMDLEEADNRATLDDFVCPKLFSGKLIPFFTCSFCIHF